MNNNKIEIDGSIIEIQNNWIGVQTILVNGKELSKSFSLSGSNHYFTIMEKGIEKSYILTTKTYLKKKKQLLETYQLLVDLKCDGKLIKENVLIDSGPPKRDTNKNKNDGMKFLKDYQIENAIKAFKLGIEYSDNDPEIYFYLACCYSLKERTEKGFECLQKAIEHNLIDQKMIRKHDMLAHIRIQEKFEEFMNSNNVTF